MEKDNIWNQGIGYDQCDTLETCLIRDMYIKQELPLDLMLCKYPTHHTQQQITCKTEPPTSQLVNINCKIS